MTDAPGPIRDDQLERYLDGSLDDAERAAFDESLRADSARRREVELQARIDATLGRLFRAETPDPQHVTAVLAAAGASDKPKTAQRGAPALWWGVAGLAAAAALAFAIAGPLLRSSR